MDALLRVRTISVLQLPVAHLQRCALPAIFALIGLLMGSWASRIPALQEGLQISHSALSLVLLCGGLGGVLSHPIASAMMIKLGSRKSMLIGGLAMCGVLPAIGAAPNMTLLMLAVLMLGLTGGCFGVAVNAFATNAENKSGESRMSMLHACGCAGSLAGALLGSLAAGKHIGPASHFLHIALPIALLFWLSHQWLDADDGRVEPAVKNTEKKFALPNKRFILLGVLGFCAAMSENSIADWGGVFLKEQFNVSAGFAPLALSAFTITMLLARLVGDRLKQAHGARRLITLGASVSAAGLFLATFAPNQYVALAGFACSGLGLSLVFPFILSAIGKEGPLALASVVTMANIGGLMGPPLVGAIADVMGMQVTIGFIGALSMIMALVASRSSMLK